MDPVGVKEAKRSIGTPFSFDGGLDRGLKEEEEVEEDMDGMVDLNLKEVEVVNPD